MMNYSRQKAIAPFIVLAVIASFVLLIGNRHSGEKSATALSSDSYDEEQTPLRRRETSNNKNYKNKLIDHVSGTTTLAGGEESSSYSMSTNLNDLKAEQQEYRPPLSDLVHNDEVSGDVQFLLDFAIVGHSKTGTTAHMNWLANHEEVQMYHHEVHSLKNGNPAELTELLYALPEGRQYKRGYKSPNDVLSDKAMDSIYKYWPQTKLIVGVRHPVKWFESYYNFNTRQGHTLPPAETMVGKHMSAKPKYHEHLAMLGKTKLDDEAEYGLLGGLGKQISSGNIEVRHYPNKVFMYEVSQPFDHDSTRAATYSTDLSNYLGLSPPLEPIVPRTSASRNYHYAIDICDKKFVELRKELMEIGRNASDWIKNYFLDSPDVTVSQPNHFIEMISTSWKVDPCDK